jgi:hypothetical protein
MFSVFCPRHGATVLLDASCMNALAWGLDGFEVHWQCWCGELGTERVPRWDPQGTASPSPSVPPDG